MKRSNVALSVLVVILGWSLLNWIDLSYAQRRRSPGLEPYTPTRIEWLVLELQANAHHEMVSLSDYQLEFMGSTDPETVVMVVSYGPNVTREAMNIGIEAARELARVTVKLHGWHDWVKIREDIKMSQPER